MVTRTLALIYLYIEVESFGYHTINQIEDYGIAINKKGHIL